MIFSSYCFRRCCLLISNIKRGKDNCDDEDKVGQAWNSINWTLKKRGHWRGEGGGRSRREGKGRYSNCQMMSCVAIGPGWHVAMQVINAASLPYLPLFHILMRVYCCKLGIQKEGSRRERNYHFFSVGLWPWFRIWFTPGYRKRERERQKESDGEDQRSQISSNSFQLAGQTADSGSKKLLRITYWLAYQGNKYFFGVGMLGCPPTNPSRLLFVLYRNFSPVWACLPPDVCGYDAVWNGTWRSPCWVGCSPLFILLV